MAREAMVQCSELHAAAVTVVRLCHQVASRTVRGRQVVYRAITHARAAS